MGRSFTSGDGAWLKIDMSELYATTETLRMILTKSQFQKLMHRTFKEVGERSKPIISREVVKDYAVTQKWVKEQIGSYRLGAGLMGGITCIIPLKGAKGSIGGRFHASGGSGGKHQRRKITANIVTAKKSELPPKMKNQGGNAPFINRASGKLGGAAFTRRTKARFPIVRVVGLGVPQMPLNRSADKVQDEILELAGKRLEHNFMHLMNTRFK